MAFSGDDKLQMAIRAMRRAPAHKTTRTGRVVGISQHYDDKNMARLELEDVSSPAAKRGPKGGPATAGDYRMRFEAVVPKGHTAGLKLGDRVDVHTMIARAK